MENTLEQWQEIKSQSQVSLDLEKNRHDEDSVLIWVLTLFVKLIIK